MALFCPRCNRSKGPNIAGIDPETNRLTRLFHPREDRWHEHFAIDGARLLGLTAVGRTTVAVLQMNDPIRVTARMLLMEEGQFPHRAPPT